MTTQREVDECFEAVTDFVVAASVSQDDPAMRLWCVRTFGTTVPAIHRSFMEARLSIAPRITDQGDLAYVISGRFPAGFAPIGIATPAMLKIPQEGIDEDRPIAEMLAWTAPDDASALDDES